MPARILRSFLKQPGSPNIPIQAIGLSLYEALPPSHASGANTPGDVEQLGTKVTRTQWLDLTSLGEMENLVGKRILIVDEVDDTRTTLEYAVKELEKDVELARQKLGGKGEKTVFSVFVLHVRLISTYTLLPRTNTKSLNRTRTRTRRVNYQRICSTTTDTWPPGLCQMFGFATHGRLRTSMRTTKWRENSRQSRYTW